MEQLALEQSNSSVAHSRMSHKLRMLNENQSYMYGNSQLLTSDQVRDQRKQDLDDIARL